MRQLLIHLGNENFDYLFTIVGRDEELIVRGKDVANAIIRNDEFVRVLKTDGQKREVNIREEIDLLKLCPTYHVD